MVAGAILMETVEAKCPKCGKTYQLRSKQDSVICDCWQTCPTCGEEMTPYTPDTAPKTYGLDGLREMKVLMVCTRHHPHFYSTQKPVEVKTDA
jgi:predicted RNA-binding Zn-ribbon protein involved in translation (DUF1610 family)